ncbi:MAG: ABC transporter permease [Treponema sp.]|nr:ABC transporter permease [Treponema sp.]
MIKTLINKLETVGRYFGFLGEVLLSLFRPPFRFSLFLGEIERLGVNSIWIIFLSGGAMGMIFSLQMVSMLQLFQAETAVGAAVAVALARELAPVITTLMLIAKNGSAMAAELGTMKVTEQIDALEAMSIDPAHYLVLPRVTASLFVYPALTVLANVVGSLGSYVITIFLFNVDSANYLDYMFNFLNPRDIVIGLIKSAFMGVMVATICCFCGLRTSQGAKGVGDSATKAVVISSVAILVADYIMTTISLKFIYR